MILTMKTYRLKTNRTASARSKRNGMVLSTELVITLPILMFMLMGLFEFSFLFFSRGDVVEASRAGARIATLSGVYPEDVEDEVKRSLGSRFGSQIQVETTLGEYSGDEVVVTVRVPMSAASPDLLWPIGYSIQNKQLVAETRMLKE